MSQLALAGIWMIACLVTLVAEMGRGMGYGLMEGCCRMQDTGDL